MLVRVDSGEAHQNMTRDYPNAEDVYYRSSMRQQMPASSHAGSIVVFRWRGNAHPSLSMAMLPQLRNNMIVQRKIVRVEKMQGLHNIVGAEIANHVSDSWVTQTRDQ